jgi:hypothetical protein
MKKKLLSAILLMAISLVAFKAFSQKHLVNTNWTGLTGFTQQIDWGATCVDVNRNLYTTGNTTDSTANTNIQTSKFDRRGNVLWQVE